MFKNILIIVVGGAILFGAFSFAMNLNNKKVINNQVEVKTLPETPAVLGGDKDANGCIGSAGYSWCQVKGKCLRTWEEACPVE